MSAALRAQRFVALFVTVLAATIALLATGVAFAPDADAAPKRKIHHAVKVAKRQVGDRYSYGADGPNAFDCSGLFYFAFKEHSGVFLPRSADGQYRFTRHIKKRNMHRGDFMFFYGGGGVYHVGMFLKWKDGRRVLLHSPSTGQDVRRSKVWTGQWHAATLRHRH